ncbi:MAG: exosortase-associated EpsI family protein [Phycisphaerales bacterium]|nr:MAG: exosortase-associated EpsI family protein [Phycisphaerales bacterium]
MRFDRQATIAFVVACIVLGVSGIGFRFAIAHLNVHLRKMPVELREHFSRIPRHLGEWRAYGTDRSLDATVEEVLGTDQYLDRTYVREVNGQAVAMNLHIAYYTGIIDAVPHVPDRCMVAGGFVVQGQPFYVDLPLETSAWELDEDRTHRSSGLPYPTMTFADRITNRPMQVRMPIGDFRIRTTEFTLPSQPGARVFAGFYFVANGQVTASPYAIRALAFDRTDQYAYYCKIQFTMIGDSELDATSFAEHVTDLTEQVLPEIMRCLPDWAEVEAKQESST